MGLGSTLTDPDSYGTGCTLDGVTVDCAMAGHMMERGMAAAAPPDMMVGLSDGRQVAFVAVIGPGGQIYSGYMEPGSSFKGAQALNGEEIDRIDLLRNHRTDLPLGFSRGGVPPKSEPPDFARVFYKPYQKELTRRI